MHSGNLKMFDIADGEGVRVSLFVSGCTNHCPGCFQPQTWDFNYGKLYDDAVEKKILDALRNENVQGLTLLGGEPWEPENQKELVKLLRKVKELLPEKDIWSYTGFVYDRDLIPGGRKYCDETDEMLSYIDVLVDGPFIENKKNITLLFRGSENQRLIDMKKTRESGNVVLWKN